MPLTRRQAKHEALKTAAAMLMECDLYKIFGTLSEDHEQDEQILTDGAKDAASRIYGLIPPHKSTKARKP